MGDDDHADRNSPPTVQCRNVILLHLWCFYLLTRAQCLSNSCVVAHGRGFLGRKRCQRWDGRAANTSVQLIKLMKGMAKSDPSPWLEEFPAQPFQNDS